MYPPVRLLFKDTLETLLAQILTRGGKMKFTPEAFDMISCHSPAEVRSKARNNCVMQKPERNTAAMSNRDKNGKGATILTFDAGVNSQDARGYGRLSQIHVSPGASRAEARLPVFFFDVRAEV